MTLSIRSAFSLVELIVVMSIVALLAGITFSSGFLKHDETHIQVDKAARGVEMKLLEARNLAAQTGKPHCVIFHIENKGSGRILVNGSPEDAKSFPGRHWCAVIGPAKNSDYLPRMPQYPENGTTEYSSAQRLAATVEKAQIGDRFYLPKGTRFLALGDAEDNLNNKSGGAIPYNLGHYQIPDWTLGTRTRTGVVAHSNTYPRPWFGFMEGSGTSWTLHAFAGYDPGIYGSGLDYECTQRSSNHNYSSSTMKVFIHNNAQTSIPVANSTNSQLCQCWYTPSMATATPAMNTMMEEMRPCCDQTQLNRTDKDGNPIPHPRPVVNGYWMDYAIVFLANGQARTLAFYNRAALFSPQTWLDASSRVAPRHVAKTQYGGTVKNWTYHGRDDAIIHILGEAIGGPSITIAKDASDDNSVFPSPQEALRAMFPLRRIVVSEPTGGVRVLRPTMQIQTWLDDIEANLPESQRIWKNGWVYCNANDSDPNKIRVTGALEADMLLQHDPYPWIKPKP